MTNFPRWDNLSELLPEEIELFVNRSFKREPILKEIEEFAKENKVPILLPSAASFLRLIVSVLKPTRILEIGTGIGYSALNVLYCLKGNCNLVTVDTNKKRLDIAKNFFLKSGFDVQVLNMDGFSYVREALFRGEAFDFIFIDSVKAEYPFFNYKIQALLSKGGVAVFDNVLFRGYICGNKVPKGYTRTVNLLRKFINDVEFYPNFSKFLLPVGDGLLVIKQEIPD